MSRQLLLGLDDELPLLPEPSPTPPPACPDPLDRVLDDRTTGDLFQAAHGLCALSWWLTLRPVVGESLRDVLRRAEGARSAACLGSGPELARAICEGAGVLPKGGRR